MKRQVILALAALLLAALSISINAAAEEISLSSPEFAATLEQRYFFDDYNALSRADKNSGVSTFESTDIVFKPVTWQELVYLFEQEGNSLILFGGSWCGNTRSAIPYINAYAQEYGIDTIYTFDFRLDGSSADTHIRVTSSDAQEKTDGELVNYLYGELVSRYITNLTDWVEYTQDSESAVTYTNDRGEEVTVAKVQVPFLFLYNKDNTVDNSGKEQTDGTTTFPIVYGFEEMILRDGEGVYNYVYNEDGSRAVGEDGTELCAYITDEYLARLRGVFDYIRDNDIRLIDYTDADFVRLAFNEERFEKLEGVEYRIGQPIFAADEPINLHVLTYRELLWLLEQPGDALIFFGGNWCANTQAAVATVNDYAVANDLIVYWYDPAWDSYWSRDAWDYTITTDPRYGATGFNHRYARVPFVKGYVDLVTRYLTNLTVSDDISLDFGGVHYDLSFHFDYTDENGETYSVGSLQVPYLLAYNRDAVDEDGFPAPIFAFVEDAVYHLEQGADDYIYRTENYEKYTSEVSAVFEAYAGRTGGEAVQIEKRATVD